MSSSSRTAFPIRFGAESLTVPLNRITSIIVVLDDGSTHFAEPINTAEPLTIDLSNERGSDTRPWLTWTDTMGPAIYEAAEYSPSCEINLAGNRLRDEELRALLTLLRGDTYRHLRAKLTSIQVNQNRLTVAGIRELFQFLEDCPACRYVRTSINDTNRAECEALPRPAHIQEWEHVDC